MNNNLNSLSNTMFEMLERINDDSLSDEELDREIKKAKTMTGIANIIINTADLEFQAAKYANEYTKGVKLPDVIGIEGNKA